MEAKFKLMEKVRLIDGGVEMRVVDVIDDESKEAPSYRCVWPGENGNGEGVYPEALLMLSPAKFIGGSKKIGSKG